MSDDVRRYAQLGWTYEKFNPLRREEIAWHRQLAGVYGGPILELACGSGRLCTALAMAGHTVDAVDRSSAMLIRARQRIGALTDDTRKRIRLIEADIGSFSLDDRYRLIIIADNSLAELPDQTRAGCLRCARKHIDLNGRLVLTARVYDRDILSHGRVITRWSAPVTHPITGVQVRRKTELEISSDGTRLQGTMTYEITKPDQSIDFEICPVDYAHYIREDYVSLLKANGWAIEADYAPDDPDGASDSAVVRFVCRLQ